MAYPTTLALITALWSGPARTRSIALWSALGGAIAALGPLLAGALLEQFDWGSVFLSPCPSPPSPCSWRCGSSPPTSTRPPTRSTTSAACSRSLLVAALVLAINFAPVPARAARDRPGRDRGRRRGRLRVLRQRRARAPLYDLQIAARRTFWVAACAGIIVFGSLMGAMFIGQQFLQNVLGYSTFDAGLAILPAAVCMVLVAPRSAQLVERAGRGRPCWSATPSVCSASWSCSCSGRRTSPTGRSASATP